ncbi:MAG: hypothetical protein ACLPHP_16400 [Candidatus Sulfotelmatobacter sp.]
MQKIKLFDGDTEIGEIDVSKISVTVAAPRVLQGRQILKIVANAGEVEMHLTAARPNLR